MRRVIIETPFAARGSRAVQIINRRNNVRYARACVRDAVMMFGEAPIASHLLLTQPGILRDDLPAERLIGIDAGLAWVEVADATVVYVDRGISKGMEEGIRAAESAGIPVVFRSLFR